MSLHFPVERPRSRGFALVIALVVVALVTLLAVTVSSDFLLNFRQVENQQLMQRAWAYFGFSEGVARYALRQDFDQDGQDGHASDTPGELWSQPVEQLFEHAGQSVLISGRLSDLQGRFNLNSLGSTNQDPALAAVPKLSVAQQRFVRLLQTFEEPELDQQRATAIAMAVSDWVDADDTVSGLDGAEQLYYSDQESPLRPPGHGFMASVSELRYVKGVDDELYRALQPHVTVWPPDAGADINFNTASANLLRSFNDDDNLQPLSEVEMETLRDTLIGFDPPSVPDSATVGGRKINLKGMDVRSQWFVLDTRVALQNREFRLRSLLLRESGDTRVLARSLGEL